MIVIALSFLSVSILIYSLIHIIKNLVLYQPYKGNQEEYDEFRIPRQNISFAGQSLGCAVAISCKNINSLICISPFYSLPSIVYGIFKQLRLGFYGWIISLCMDSDYRSDRLMRSIHDTKILIAHSKKDELIPYKEAQDLGCLAFHHDFSTIAGCHKHPEFTEQFIKRLVAAFQSSDA